MKVLLVDGPKAGEVHEVTGSSLMVAVPNDLGLEDFHFNFETGEFGFTPTRVGPVDLSFSQVVYRFHTVRAFGHVIKVGSVNPEGPKDWDMFRLLTSDAAKSAVNV